MTPAARLSAVIEVLDDLDKRPRPVNDALKDWALSRRFAGSGDRAGIGAMVHDALRKRNSARWIMESESARATALGMMRSARGMDAAEIGALCDGSRFAPEALSEAEVNCLENRNLADAPDHVRGDYPEWLAPSLASLYGKDVAAEGAALSERAPLDLRVNTLKTMRVKALPALSEYEAVAGKHGPDSIRIPPRADGRIKPVQVDPLFLKGMVEIQDEGSQIVARLANPGPGEQVLDLCAGGGGKSLALGALLNNKGQVFATDADARRLAPIHERLTRAGVRNVQVRTPRGGVMPLEDLKGRMDVVFVDAPCTGTGTWRRNPDAKWRLRPTSLELRMREQGEVIENAYTFVREEGILIYVTCSILPEENDDQVAKLIAAHTDLQVVDLTESSAFKAMPTLATGVLRTRHGLQLTPYRTGTDGFYIAAMRRVAA
ncbi:MAG: RsmB/NOP family class I SAM-dependent RNA methyltransferase [Beijerinckiaceae bacterium]